MQLSPSQHDSFVSENAASHVRTNHHEEATVCRTRGQACWRLLFDPWDRPLHATAAGQLHARAWCTHDLVAYQLQGPAICHRLWGYVFQLLGTKRTIVNCEGALCDRLNIGMSWLYVISVGYVARYVTSLNSLSSGVME